MVPPANTTTHPDYNHIFEKLVIGTELGTKERLIGMIAYADYKEEKYQWKEQYRNTHDVDTVPSEAVKTFLLSYHDGKLDKLRNDAEEMLYVFAEHYSEKSSLSAYEDGKESTIINEIRTHNAKNYSAIKRNNFSVAQKVSSNYDGWWVSGFKGALGSAIFTFIALVISILFSVANPDTNYGKLVQFILGQREFLILHPNDCRLKNANENCEK